MPYGVSKAYFLLFGMGGPWSFVHAGNVLSEETYCGKKNGKHQALKN